MSNTPIILDHDELTSTLAMECHKFISGLVANNPSILTMEMSFLSKFIGIMLYSSLVRSSEAHKEVNDADKKVDLVYLEWKEAKSSLQEHISVGVAAGLEEFTGKFVDYYCTIVALSESVSKEVN